MSEKKSNTLIFPTDSASIIDDILEKNGLLETDEELLKKLEKREYGFGKLLADLAIKICEQNITTVAQMASLIQIELKTNKQKSQKIAGELKEGVIDRIIKTTGASIVKKNTDNKKSTSPGETVFGNKTAK